MTFKKIQSPKGSKPSSKPQQSFDEKIAVASLSPSVNASLVTQAFYGNKTPENGQALIREIHRVVKNVSRGRMHDMEAMLVAQALALQGMFTSLCLKGASAEHRLHKESNLKLALRAQNQGRAAIATLVDLKFPKQATFVRQANIAAGAQQVNNTVQPTSLSRAKEDFAPQNKLLEATDGQIIRMDTRTPAKAKRSHTQVGTVGKLDRATKPRR